jgi:hypothetical protein
MASISTVVSITITKGTKTVSLQSFNVACIFGPSNRFGDVIRYYTDPSDMLTDGFLVSDPEYIFATELMEQSPSPKTFAVSKFTAAVAQVDTITPSAVNNHAYKVTIDGVDYTYTSDSSATVSEIVTGLLALINADSNAACAATGTTTVILTAKVAGVGFTTSINADANMSLAHTTANHSIAQDIAATQAVDDSWYGVLVTSHVTSDIQQVAAYVESQLKVYGTSSSDSGIISTSTTDLASYLKGKSYSRTYLLYSATPGDAPEAAWMGRMFPTTPGAANWNFKTLVGITPDNLSQTQITNAQGKNCNVYITIGGLNIATIGVTPGGEYIDVTIFIDWLSSTMQANIFSVLVNSDKVPYTNKGIAAIENPISQTLQQGQDNGGLAAGWTVSAPDVADVSQIDKASRTLNNVAFEAELAGAINKVNVQGFVSV